MKKLSARLTSRNGMFFGVFAVALLLQTQGFCDGTGEAALQEASKKVTGFLFGPTIRKIALTLGLGGGLFQSFMSGSMRPLLIYGGIGLAVCYLPGIVEWISDLAPVQATAAVSILSSPHSDI